MARVPNPKNEIANNSASYIINQLKQAITDFQEELNIDNKLKQTYVNDRDNSAKSHICNAIRMSRWLHEIEFGLNPQVPLTNSEVDAIDENIRTSEERR